MFWIVWWFNKQIRQYKSIKDKCKSHGKWIGIKNNRDTKIFLKECVWKQGRKEEIIERKDEWKDWRVEKENVKIKKQGDG